MLSEFTPKGQQQADLLAPSSAQSDALMAVMDQIKAKGLGRVGFASQGTGSPEWMMRQEHLSPCYTTSWEDLPVARYKPQKVETVYSKLAGQVNFGREIFFQTRN